MYMRGNRRKQWETKNNGGSELFMMIGDEGHHLESG
jgi:hypothetical protein